MKMQSGFFMIDSLEELYTVLKLLSLQSIISQLAYYHISTLKNYGLFKNTLSLLRS